MAIKGVPEYIESMKPSLPYAEELAALAEVMKEISVKQANDTNPAN